MAIADYPLFQAPLSLRQWCALGITGYQRYLSPYKGFRCAHAVCHPNTSSCAAVVKRTILVNGLWHALPLIRQRFEGCRKAAAVLQARRERIAAARMPKEEEEEQGVDLDAVADVADFSLDLALDSLDCSGLDCGVLDCGGAACI